MPKYLNDTGLAHFWENIKLKYGDTGQYNYWGVSGKYPVGSGHYLYASNDGINFIILKELPEITRDSCAAIKIGKYYYITGANSYDYSTNLQNWNVNNVYNDVVSVDRIWGAFIFSDTNADKLYLAVSSQYNNNVVPLTGVGGTTYYFRIDAYELEQQSDGTLINITPNSPTTLLYDSAGSYIDPSIIYVDSIGYVMAVKNEVTSKFEFYSGNSLTNLSKININCPITGIEGPQLIAQGNNIVCYFDGYNPRTMSAHDDAANAILAENSLTPFNGWGYVMKNGAWVNNFLCNLCGTNYHMRHMSIAPVHDIDTRVILNSIKSNTFTLSNPYSRIRKNPTTYDNNPIITQTNWPYGMDVLFGGSRINAKIRYVQMFDNSTPLNGVGVRTNSYASANITIGNGFSGGANETALLIAIDNNGANYFYPTTWPALPIR